MAMQRRILTILVLTASFYVLQLHARSMNSKYSSEKTLNLINKASKNEPQSQQLQFNNAQNIDSKAKIIKFEHERSKSGSYRYSFETTNGLLREETGDVLNANSDQESLEVRGSYSFMSPDGAMHLVHYVADKYGYRPYIEIIRPNVLTKNTQYNNNNNLRKKFANKEDKNINNVNGNLNAIAQKNASDISSDGFVDFIGTALLASLNG